MSMHWNPGKATVDLKQVGAEITTGSSKIRRDPGKPLKLSVRHRRSDEAETWLGIAGIVMIAAAVVAVVVGTAWATYSKPKLQKEVIESPTRF